MLPMSSRPASIAVAIPYPGLRNIFTNLLLFFFGVLLDQMELEMEMDHEKPAMSDLRKKVLVLSKMATIMAEVRRKNDAVVKLQGLYGGKDQREIVPDIQIPHDYNAVKNFDTPNELSPLSARNKSTAPPDIRFWKSMNRSRRNSRERGNRLLISHEVDEAYFDVRDNTSKTEWAIFGYEEDISPPPMSDTNTPSTVSSTLSTVSPKLTVRAKGSNGLQGMLAVLPPHQRAYIYLRMTSGDGLSIRAKFVLIHWVPENIQPRKRAEVSTHKGFVKEVITECSLEIHATEISDIVDKLKGSVGTTNT